MQSRKVPIVKTLLWFRLWKDVGWKHAVLNGYLKVHSKGENNAHDKVPCQMDMEIPKKSTVYIKIFHPGQYEDSSKADCDKDTKEHYQSAENDQVS